jgi:crotonobetainyl-CoA:carnitine CoA-transferase CaiB-like acyl-CoA transferase
LTSGPLDGVVVVDFTHILAGPFCTQLLADAGATVTKIEPPGGEWARRRGPRRVGPEGSQVSSYFAAVNRGKRSVMLDLKSPPGKALAEQLVVGADVVVENFSPGTMERLGLGLADFRARRPRLITASISLFGGYDTAGALAERGGLAVVAEAESSLMSQHRGRDGHPITTPYGLGDMASGLAAYGAITTALFERERTGQGRHLDIAMTRVLLAVNSISITGEQIRSEPGVQQEDSRTAGMGIFPATDGYVAIGVNSDSLFARLALATGRPEITDNPRYASHVTRDSHVDEVNTILEDWSRDRTVDEILAALSPAGVPCGRVNTPRDMLDSPTSTRLALFEVVDDGMGGTIRSPANPFGFQPSLPSLPTARVDQLALNASEGLNHKKTGQPPSRTGAGVRVPMEGSYGPLEQAP